METSHPKSAGYLHHEDSWTCHRCGWIYPNPHPSAKHRRNHKKHCGKVQGFELKGQSTELHKGGSSDEASSDEEGHSKKGHDLYQHPEVLPGQHDSINLAAMNESFSPAEAAAASEATERQISAGGSVTEQPRDFSGTEDKSIDTKKLEEPLSLPVSLPLDIQRKDGPDGQISGGGLVTELPRDFSGIEDKLLDAKNLKDPVSLPQSLPLGSQGKDGSDGQVSAGGLVTELSRDFSGTKDKEIDAKNLEESVSLSDSDGQISTSSFLGEQLKASSRGDEKLTHEMNLEEVMSSPDSLQCDIQQTGGLDSVIEADRSLSLKESSTEQNAAPVLKPGNSVAQPQEDLWRCQHCGWTYPNAHPSAKHRRNHKKHCSKIKGLESGTTHVEVVGGSSDEASDDESNHKHREHGSMVHKTAESSVEPPASVCPSSEEVHSSLLQETNAKDVKDIQVYSEQVGVETETRMLGLQEAPLAHLLPDLDSKSNSVLSLTDVSPVPGTNKEDTNAKRSAEQNRIENAVVSEERILVGEVTSVAIVDDGSRERDTVHLSGEISRISQPVTPSEMKVPVCIESSKDIVTPQVEETKDGMHAPIESEVLVLGPAIVKSQVGAGKLDTLPLAGQDTQSDQISVQNLVSYGVSNKVMAEEEPMQKKDLLDFIPIESDGSSLAKEDFAEAGFSVTVESEKSTGFSSPKDNKFPNSEILDVPYVETEVSDFKHGPEEDAEKKLKENNSETMNQKPPDQSTSNSDANLVSKEDAVTHVYQDRIEELPGTCKSSVEVDNGMNLETVDQRPENEENVNDKVEEDAQISNSAVLQEGGPLCGIRAVELMNTNKSSGEDNMKLQDGTPIHQSCVETGTSAEKSGSEKHSEEKVEGELHNAKSQGLPGMVLKVEEPESGSVTSLVSHEEVQAAALGRLDSADETFEDAPDSLETCSVGGSVDENEIVEDMRQITSEKFEEHIVDSHEANTSDCKVLEAGTDPKVLPNVVGKAATSEAGSNDKDTPMSNKKLAVVTITEDLKAPSPEAWQELGTSEAGSEENEAQTEESGQAVAVPKSSDTDLKENQITEKTHTPLRSLLAKEGSEKVDLKQKDSTVDTREELKTVEGGWASPSVRKRKTRSIWSHCICCPAVH